MDTKSILVTGGAGFIGSNIVEYLFQSRLVASLYTVYEVLFNMYGIRKYIRCIRIPGHVISLSFTLAILICLFYQESCRLSS